MQENVHRPMQPEGDADTCAASQPVAFFVMHVSVQSQGEVDEHKTLISMLKPLQSPLLASWLFFTTDATLEYDKKEENASLKRGLKSSETGVNYIQTGDSSRAEELGDMKREPGHPGWMGALNFGPARSKWKTQ